VQQLREVRVVGQLFEAAPVFLAGGPPEALADGREIQRILPRGQFFRVLAAGVVLVLRFLAGRVLVFVIVRAHTVSFAFSPGVSLSDDRSSN
jgi:hypothetical protein